MEDVVGDREIQQLRNPAPGIRYCLNQYQQDGWRRS